MMKLILKLRDWLTRPKQPDMAASEIITVRCGQSNIRKIKATHLVRNIKTEELDIFFREIEKSGDKFNTWETNKLLAAEAVADLLGLEELITHTEYANLECDGKAVFGSIQNRAKGICIISVTHEKRREMLTPEFQRAINNLSLIDAICHEGDHSPNNYNVVLDENGRAVSVEAFDNNSYGAFSMNKSIAFESYKGCSAFTTDDGRINRPYMDKGVVEKLRSISFFEVYNALKKHLRIVPIIFTWMRIIAIRKAIRKTAVLNPGFLLKENEWSQQTIEEELNGKYGKTYLGSYIQDCCVPYCDKV